MAYNNYGNYGYTPYPQYNANMGYQNFQQPTMQNTMLQNQMMQPQTQSSEIPFSESHYGTMKEAEAYIVPPMKSVLFMNKANGEIYVKSADNMGNPSFETFKKVGVEEKQTETQQVAFNPEEYIKRTELKDFAEKSDLKGLVTQETFESFFNDITKELNGIKKSIDIKKTLENGIKGV